MNKTNSFEIADYREFEDKTFSAEDRRWSANHCGATPFDEEYFDKSQAHTFIHFEFADEGETDTAYEKVILDMEDVEKLCNTETSEETLNTVVYPMLESEFGWIKEDVIVTGLEFSNDIDKYDGSFQADMRGTCWDYR